MVGLDREAILGQAGLNVLAQAEVMPTEIVIRKKPTSTFPLWLHLAAFLSSKTPNTQSTYLGIFREWCAFLGVEFGALDAIDVLISVDSLRALSFRAWLEQRPGEVPRSMRGRSTSREVEVVTRKARKKDGLESTQSNATIAKKLACLRRLYRMFISNQGLTHNPFSSDVVNPPRATSGQKRPTQMVPFDVVNRIIAAPNKKTERGQRDQAILAVLFGGGLRRGEVSRLRLGDVRVVDGLLCLHLRAPKNGKDALQALPPWAANILNNYLCLRTYQGALGLDFLFPCYSGPGGNTLTGRAISDSGIYQLFKEHCKTAGAGDFVTPHSARATAITWLLASGTPHRKVQEFSRHASIAMVELYDKRTFGVRDNPGRDISYK